MAPHALTVYFERRTWAEFGYALIGLPLGIFAFVFTVTTLAVSLGFVVTIVGLPLLAATAFASRWLAAGMRRAANAMADAGVPPPPPMAAGSGRFGRIGSAIRDSVSWRARAYLVLKLPMGIATFVTAVVFWTYGLGAVTYWFWRPFLPCNDSTTGECHRGAQFGDSYPWTRPAASPVSPWSACCSCWSRPGPCGAWWRWIGPRPEPCSDHGPRSSRWAPCRGSRARFDAAVLIEHDDIESHHDRFAAPGGPSPQPNRPDVMLVDLADRSEHQARELLLRRRDGRIEACTALDGDERIGVVRRLAPVLGDERATCRGSVSFQQAR